MSSFTRTIERSAIRASVGLPTHHGRGSKLGLHNEDKPVGHQKGARKPRGSRRGTSKARGPFGKGGAA